MLTSKDPRDSLFQEGSSRFLFGRDPSACPLVFPLCLVFPPVDRHSRLDLSHYYTRFSYYTRHPFYSVANVEKRSLRAATLGSRFTPSCRSLPFALVRPHHHPRPRSSASADILLSLSLPQMLRCVISVTRLSLRRCVRPVASM